MAKRVPAIVLVASLIALAACSAGSSSSSGTSKPCAGSMPGSTSRDAVSTWCSAYGAILVNGKGYTLYASSADTANKSACASSCAAIWPPLAVSGTPKLGPGLNKSLVGDVIRTDGNHQLTYGGHPLYAYRADTGPHLVNGQRLKSFGGTWYVVSATTGKLITKKPSTKHKGNGPGY
jgi:predicted lipoprotein with Yx(FWY)xxD motif